MDVLGDATLSERATAREASAPVPRPEGRPVPDSHPASFDPHVPEPATIHPHPRARRGPGLGAGSVLCAFGMCVATVVGSIAAGTVLAPAAVPIAVLALVLSAAAIALGAVAAIRSSGRVLGIVGAVLGILLNPALLALVLPGGPS